MKLILPFFIFFHLSQALGQSRTGYLVCISKKEDARFYTFSNHDYMTMFYMSSRPQDSVYPDTLEIGKQSYHFIYTLNNSPDDLIPCCETDSSDVTRLKMNSLLQESMNNKKLSNRLKKYYKLDKKNTRRLRHITSRKSKIATITNEGVSFFIIPVKIEIGVCFYKYYPNGLQKESVIHKTGIIKRIGGLRRIKKYEKDFFMGNINDFFGHWLIGNIIGTLKK